MRSIRDTLLCLLNLFEDAEKLKEKYGLADWVHNPADCDFTGPLEGSITSNDGRSFSDAIIADLSELQIDLSTRQKAAKKRHPGIRLQ